MSDARDLINLAEWMERRKIALGPYGDHILDGVKRYEARIAHHDAVVRELVEAAQELLDEKDDYMRRNNLGDPMKETVSARVRAALAKIAQEGKP